MVSENPETIGEDVDFISATPRRRRISRMVLFGFVGILALILVTVLALDTPPGRRFLIDRIEAMEPANGLRIRIGRIDGSIYGRMTISDLRLYDPEGLFFEAPEIELDWQPGFYLYANRLHLSSLTSELGILHRAPGLIPSDEQNQSILPSFDIHVGTLDIARFRFEEAITGERRHASLAGKADIRSGRARLQLQGNSLDSEDRLALNLDAEPDGDVFDLNVDLYAPGDGIIAGLTGIERSLAIDIGGSGTWEQWDGYARADSGDDRVINLDLEARDGAFVLDGLVRTVDLLDPGIARRLTAPELDLTARATFADSRLTGEFDARSQATVVEGRGAIDFAQSAFDGFTAVVRLLDPSALSSGIDGRNVQMTVGLDGAFDSAEFRYQLTSPQAIIEGIGFDNLRVAGEGRLSETPFSLPMRATAARISGLEDAVGGDLRSAAIDGALLITADQIVGNDLRLRSDRLRGRATARYDLAAGSYLVALDADLDRYPLPGLGMFDIRAQVDLSPGPEGRVTVQGQARAVTRALENGFFQSLTGGPTTVDAQIGYQSDRRFTFDAMQLRSPQLEFTGNGHLDGEGQLSITGSGEQTQYGPLTISAQGEPGRPRVELGLANPVPAAGIANVSAILEPTGFGYQYTAEGQSLAGAFTSAGLMSLPANAPVSVAVQQLLVADTQIEGGFAFRDGGIVGALDLTGTGVDGDIELSMVGGEQLVTVDIDAENARLGGEIDATMRQAILDMNWRPFADEPTVGANLTLTGFHRRGVSLPQFGATVALENGQGDAELTLAGARGRDFDFEAIADITTEAIVIDGGGSFRGEPISLTPLVMRREEEGWVIPETTISHAGGSATLAARFGGPLLDIDATADRVSLSLFDVFYPETGFGGQATGSLRYRQGAEESVPLINAALRVRNLTREGPAFRPQPVDLGLNLRLENRRLASRAIMERDGEEILRFQARLDPIAGEGNFGDLIAVAPLFAELRYDGPTETLWQLTGNETLSLTGPLLARMDIGGTLSTPQIRGALQTQNGRLESALTGTVVEGVTTEGIFRQSRLEFAELSGVTPGGGSISGRAVFDLGLATGLGMDIVLEAERAWLLRRDDISAQVSGPLTIRLQAPAGTAIGTETARPTGTISGNFEMTRGEFTLGQAAPSIIVPQLNVTEINRRLDEPDPRVEPVNWTLDIDVNARNRFMVRGLGLDSEWGADLDVRGPLSNFHILGAMNLRRGSYEFAGRNFALERGRIEFYGNQPVDPTLDIVAEADAEGLDATINIGGTGNSPEITFASSPALEQSELLSRLLFGTSITNLSAPEAIQLGAALASLQSGSGLDLNPINAVRDAIGLDRLRVLPADPAVGRGTAVGAGVYVTRNLFVEVITDGQGYSATETEYRITRWLSILSSISTLGRAGADLQISRDY